MASADHEDGPLNRIIYLNTIFTSAYIYLIN